MNEEVLVLYRATSEGYEQVKSYENQSNQLPNFSDNLSSQDSYILIRGSKKRFDDLLLSKTKNDVIDYAILEEYAIKNSFEMLNNKGIILAVIYPHEEGKKEGTCIKKYLEDNNINYNEYH